MNDMTVPLKPFDECEFCNGSGIAIDMPCSRCKGLGMIKDE